MVKLVTLVNELSVCPTTLLFKMQQECRWSLHILCVSLYDECTNCAQLWCDANFLQTPTFCPIKGNGMDKPLAQGNHVTTV